MGWESCFGLGCMVACFECVGGDGYGHLRNGTCFVSYVVTFRLYYTCTLFTKIKSEDSQQERSCTTVHSQSFVLITVHTYTESGRRVQNKTYSVSITEMWRRFPMIIPLEYLSRLPFDCCLDLGNTDAFVQIVQFL